jgi:hypothetical protein
MAPLVGGPLHHTTACRILRRRLSLTGGSDFKVSARGYEEADGVDIACSVGGRRLKIKVKADPYFGSDPVKIADRDLAFYRRQGADYAFEAISHNVTRQPGWVFQSDADDLYYYFLALGQPEREVQALFEGPDEVFFTELKVERDELHIIPMAALRDWFEQHFEQYTPRPVLIGDHSAWYRLVPRAVLSASVPVEIVGSVFESVALS